MPRKQTPSKRTPKSAPKGTPLRQKAARAWRRHERRERLRGAERLMREPQILEARLRAICGDEYPVTLHTLSLTDPKAKGDDATARHTKAEKTKAKNIKTETHNELVNERIVATIDGLQFVSTYNEAFFHAMPEEMAQQHSGVRLWWRCEECGENTQSDVIRKDYELGQQLLVFAPQKTHRCRSSECDSMTRIEPT